MDKAHMMTDEILESLEKRLAREYRKANTEVEKKLRAYLDKFAADDAAQRKLLDAGKITEKDYQDWRFRHMMMNKRWQDLRDTLAEDLHNANVIARDIYRGERPEIYSLNHNYAVYQMEHDAGIDTGLTLYNRDAVNRMLTQDPQMLPPPGKKVSKRIAEGKDVRWNNRQIQSVMTQGILQGDSIPELARRLEEVTERNYTAAVRNARTMATGAQNAGRMDAYQRAAKKGVHLVQEWVAVLDMRTRHDHRMLHGVRIPIDEEWETEQGKIRFPGDPTGPPSEIYNCRCTTVSWVQGFEGETIRESPGMEGMSFEEWQNVRAAMSGDDTKRTYHNKSGAWPKNGKVISPSQLKDLTDYAESRGIHIYGFKDYDGDVGLAMEFIDGIANIADEYPMLREYRKPIQISASFALDDGTYAETNKHMIRINTYAFRDRKTISEHYAALAESGWFVTGTDYKFIPIHESAHAIINAYEVGTRDLINTIFPGMDYDEITKLITNEISEYAAQNRHELIAEAFCAYKHGKKSNLVLKILRECGIVI